MRFRIITTLCALTALAMTDVRAANPNIILMMADDMGMGDTSAYQDFTGNSDDVQLHTPQMERLARLGVRFTDAHTPASRCTPTRYGLLTGRYPWRSRIKWWVLFGSQGDPLIEADRPTLATMLGGAGYRTAMFGKWHVGLRYRQSNGKPAAGWDDADLTKPLHSSPIDLGFHIARFTSRSHGTSGPGVRVLPKNRSKRNKPDQNVGPGHIHGRFSVSATKNGKQLIGSGPNAYVLTELGGRHSDHAAGFMQNHVTGRVTKSKPFFLYYPANSNHGPYTPDDEIAGRKVAGAARTKAGEPMDARHDYIYENDVALGRMLDWLKETDDPRNPGSKLAANTIVIFTSDNGAEKNSDVASGPFRSHKGSCYEGGHRVPFIVSWPAGGVGDGDASEPGSSNVTPIGLQDLYATFAEVVGVPLPDLSVGAKGAEDSFSVLAAFRGKTISERPPLFFNDHKEAKQDPAVAAMRLDSPIVNGRRIAGQWKIFFDPTLLRAGEVNPYELYDLATDQWEQQNRLREPGLAALVDHLKKIALLHRNAGGHRLTAAASSRRVVFDWRSAAGGVSPLSREFADQSAAGLRVTGAGGLKLTVTGRRKDRGLSDAVFSPNFHGLGLGSGEVKQVEGGEALVLSFDRDVIVESAAIVAGNGTCGGFYRVGDAAPLAIYCVDADNDAKEQQGVISDIGLLKAGTSLRFDSSPHHGVEPPGRWRLGAITVRLLKD
ncbi:MAG: arylsulfatase A [Limisphaerales bacterium]|jgi:arylsulfatase A